jgi:predicted GNAT family N-acyltransferase
MITAEIIHGSKSLIDQYTIRNQVFTIEQGVPREIEQDRYDLISYHVLVCEDKIAVGTGRIINKDNQWIIGRVAVLKEYRGKHYGDLVVRKLVDYGFKSGIQKIEIHSQLPVIDFYKNIGFVDYGDIYLESNIEHKSMFITEDLFYKTCM